MAASKISYSTAFAFMAMAMMAQGVAAETATATTTSSSSTSSSTSLTPCPSNCTIFTSIIGVRVLDCLQQVGSEFPWALQSSFRQSRSAISIIPVIFSLRPTVDQGFSKKKNSDKRTTSTATAGRRVQADDVVLDAGRAAVTSAMGGHGPKFPLDALLPPRD
ncbi:hypothetical protein BKA80DRAFT_28336 [Phyllosticta citrichinensis]